MHISITFWPLNCIGNINAHKTVKSIIGRKSVMTTRIRFRPRASPVVVGGGHIAYYLTMQAQAFSETGYSESIWHQDNTPLTTDSSAFVIKPGK